MESVNKEDCLLMSHFFRESSRIDFEKGNITRGSVWSGLSNLAPKKSMFCRQILTDSSEKIVFKLHSHSVEENLIGTVFVRNTEPYAIVQRESAGLFRYTKGHLLDMAIGSKEGSTLTKVFIDSFRLIFIL